MFSPAWSLTPLDPGSLPSPSTANSSKLIRSWGYLSEWGDLYHPMDIYGSADGTIFVTDQAPRIVAFSPDGEVIGRCNAAKIYSHGIWGDAAGNLFLCEHTGTITKMARST